MFEEATSDPYATHEIDIVLVLEIAYATLGEGEVTISAPPSTVMRPVDMTVCVRSKLEVRRR